jgi:hypothetical protein
MRVFLLRIVAAKNSRNRYAACSEASATIAGTTIDAAIRTETRAGAGAMTVNSWPVLDSVCWGALPWL